jgi:hypothetical protein
LVIIKKTKEYINIIILAIDSHKFSRKMRESIEIENILYIYFQSFSELKRNGIVILFNSKSIFHERMTKQQNVIADTY